MSPVINGRNKVRLLGLVAIVLLGACASPNSFNHFYNDHKRDARLAAAVPKFLVKIFIPKEEKEVVNRLTKGMKKIKLLYEEKTSEQISGDLETFLKNHDYTEYLYLRDDGSEITLHILEDADAIREIVMRMNSDEELIIITLQGKMDKDHFDRVLDDKTL